MALSGHQEGNIWVVAKGDTLWSIAERVYGNGRKWTQIADANGIKRSSGLIYVGNRLKLPGISSTKTTTPPKETTSTKVTFEWFALDCGEERAMFAVWSYTRSNTDHYEVNWDYDTGQGGWRTGSHSTTSGNTDADKQSAYEAPQQAKKVRLQVKPIAKKNSKNKYYWTDGAWETKEYDYSNNPPELPPAPTFGIDSNDKLQVIVDNIQETINADKIEIAIYQDDTTKYSTGLATIDQDARHAQYEVQVPTGHKYKVRIRAVRGTDIYGGWTDFTENDMSHPDAPEKITTLRPEIISEQGARTYGVFAEWPEANTAKQYEIQWTTNIIYFDTGTNVQSQTTEEGQGPKILLIDLELGHTYYFRVRSINDKGNSLNWSAINSTTLGIKPSAPTTYSNTSSAIIGEDLNLYWIHNSADGSLEKQGQLYFLIVNPADPSHPTEKYITINNTRPEEEQNQTSVYTINTTDPEWSNLQSGFILKWKARTHGITSEWSDYSVEREINIYAKPTLTVDIKNQNGNPISEVNSFPFFINILSGPVVSIQTPISYYIEVVANEGYETVDDVGNVKIVNPGDKIYQKYYDPQTTNKWNFMVEMTPGNIDLENNIIYTINATVAMSSGLSASGSLEFLAYLDDVFYDVFADVIINKDTLEASIHPYCYEYNEINGEIVPSLVDGCKLAVYRREYDGSTNIDNVPNLFVNDPHPSLDYARYRVTAKTDDTGALSYADVPAEKVGEPSIVMQWSEKWSSFDIAEDGIGVVEPAWYGSMIKIPYNVDVNENKSPDVSLINYVGREHPVSYYGTHIGETASWNVEIPAEDKELLYALRRLSKWTGDVYVREPSGTGYWANVTVSLDIKHNAVTIPVSFNIIRVEGGI